uniref:Uncharacterized protein n=1 Tax=Triticum urartu TaxID=4572 RepID=A0A8R7PIY4_TRIUA
MEERCDTVFGLLLIPTLIFQWWHGVHLQRMKMELAAGIMGATGVAGLPKLDEKGGSSAGTEEGVHVLSISAHLQLADFYLKAELPTNGSQDRKLSLISQVNRVTEYTAFIS